MTIQEIVARREALKAGGAAAVCAIVGSGSKVGAEGVRVPRVDSHLHCFAGTADARFPYHERAPYRPEAAATPEHLLRCMVEGGVDYAIVVHPEPYQDDHRYLEHCLQLTKGKVKGTLLLFADQEGSLEKIPELCHKLDVVAARVHAHSANRLPPFGQPSLRRLWTMAGDHGLAVQLHFVPRYAAGFEPLIRDFPKVKVLIDHMGRPFQGTAEEHAVVMRWARFDNTIMKLSAFPDAATTPDRELAVVIRRLTDAWGAERIIFGDKFGAETTGSTYEASFARCRSFLEHLTAADQAKIFGGTAAKLFRFTG